MPWLLSAEDQAAIQRLTQGTTREQMLREVVEAVQALTADTPLVLILEDLHWSDYATLDAIAALAQRREPARLLIVGTYRPEEVALAHHPLHRLSRELQRRGRRVELPVSLLSAGAVEAYLAVRLPGDLPRARLAQWLLRHTEGNPLFLVTAIEELMQQGLLVEVAGEWVLEADPEQLELGMPASVQAILEGQFEGLDRPQRAVLEAGSVAGEVFSAAAAAAGLGMPAAEVEAQCAALTRRRRMLRAAGDVAWPDGTRASGYAFLHSLHRAAVYQELTAARRRQLHQRIGERLEQGYGNQAAEMAAELYRVKGELLGRHKAKGKQQKASMEAEAEACFQHALEVTRRQQAKSLELRAATRLSRLWYAQGRHDEARQLLADIYGWFSEGFATPDLQEARLLLDQLSHTPRSSQFASHLSPGTVKILTP